MKGKKFAAKVVATYVAAGLLVVGFWALVAFLAIRFIKWAWGI